MLVMGLDLSTCSGVAFVDENKKVVHAQEVQFKKAKGLDRCSQIAGAILGLKEEYEPSLTVIENYGFANAHSLVTLVEIGTIVRYFLYQLGAPFKVVPPNSLKKFVTGKGNAQKDQIMLSVYKQWGYEAATNNIADAVGLAMMGQAFNGVKFPAYAMEACKAILTEQEG